MIEDRSCAGSLGAIDEPRARVGGGDRAGQAIDGRSRSHRRRARRRFDASLRGRRRACAALDGSASRGWGPTAAIATRSAADRVARRRRHRRAQRRPTGGRRDVFSRARRRSSPRARTSGWLVAGPGVRAIAEHAVERDRRDQRRRRIAEQRRRGQRLIDPERQLLELIARALEPSDHRARHTPEAPQLCAQRRSNGPGFAHALPSPAAPLRASISR